MDFLKQILEGALVRDRDDDEVRTIEDGSLRQK